VRVQNTAKKLVKKITSFEDYEAVLREVKSAFPSRPAVKKVTLDFEAAAWGAFRDVFPDVVLKGCSFHWTQALWRKVS